MDLEDLIGHIFQTHGTCPGCLESLFSTLALRPVADADDSYVFNSSVGQVWTDLRHSFGIRE